MGFIAAFAASSATNGLPSSIQARQMKSYFFFNQESIALNRYSTSGRAISSWVKCQILTRVQMLLSFYHSLPIILASCEGKAS